jgi:1-acyl-sn-glycerol-3-phosphate acyltransferase
MSLKNKLKLIIAVITIITFVIISNYLSDTRRNDILRRFLHNLLLFMNIKINIHFVRTDHSILSRSNMFIMSNHTNGIDFMILQDIFTSNTDTPIYAIVKHDLVGDNTDKTFTQKCLGLIKNSFYKGFNFIPYQRENKESGSVVKDLLLEVIQNTKSNFVIFPEGQCSRSGIPKEFKYGSFKLAADNNIGIIPVSIKYKRPIGVDRSDPINLGDWSDNTVDVYIYDAIYNSDPNVLMQSVFDTIREKLI